MRGILATAQRGYISLSIGMIGLVSAAAIASPLVVRAATLLNETETTDPFRSAGTLDAAEHGVWRIANDAAFLSGMTGNPPSALYTLVFPEGTASITVTQSSSVPPGNGLNVYISVAPDKIQPNTPTTVTYTVTVINNSATTRSISQVEADPVGSFSPGYVNGSTSGFTTVNPVYGSSRWRWTISPAVTVNGFGTVATMTWQMTANESQGDYDVDGAASFVGIGAITAHTTASLRAATMNDITVSTIVSPTTVTASSSTPVTYTVTISNSATSTRTIDWLKHYTTREFDHVSGSTSGFTTGNPSRSSDGNDRYEWLWDVNVAIPAQQSRQLTFQMTGNLTPGTFYAESKMRAVEDPEATGQQATATSGNTAPILAVRTYQITAVLNGKQVTLKANLTGGGVVVASWNEQ